MASSEHSSINQHVLAIVVIIFVITLCNCSRPVAGKETVNFEPAVARERFKRHSLNDLAEVYRVEQVTTQDIEGDPIAITGWQHCEHEECEISQATKYKVRVTSTHGDVFGLNATAVFQLASKSFQLGNAVATGVATASEIEMESPAVARVMFTPKLKVIHGTMVKDARAWCVDDPVDAVAAASGTTEASADYEYEAMPGVDCGAKKQVRSRMKFSLTAPERGSQLVEGGQVLGTWWIEYKPDPKPVDDKNFYIIRDKDIPNMIDNYNYRAGSPLMCAKSAVKRGEKFAVWKAGICYIKHTGGLGKLTSNRGKPIGAYNFNVPHHKSSANSRERDSWMRTGQCDVIQEHAGIGYFCMRFQSARNTVMMFRKD